MHLSWQLLRCNNLAKKRVLLRELYSNSSIEREEKINMTAPRFSLVRKAPKCVINTETGQSSLLDQSSEGSINDRCVSENPPHEHDGLIKSLSMPSESIVKLWSSKDPQEIQEKQKKLPSVFDRSMVQSILHEEYSGKSWVGVASKPNIAVTQPPGGLSTLIFSDSSNEIVSGFGSSGRSLLHRKGHKNVIESMVAALLQHGSEILHEPERFNIAISQAPGGHSVLSSVLFEAEEWTAKSGILPMQPAGGFNTWNLNDWMEQGEEKQTTVRVSQDPGGKSSIHELIVESENQSNQLRPTIKVLQQSGGRGQVQNIIYDSSQMAKHTSNVRVIQPPGGTSLWEDWAPQGKSQQSWSGIRVQKPPGGSSSVFNETTADKPRLSVKVSQPSGGRVSHAMTNALGANVPIIITHQSQSQTSSSILALVKVTAHARGKIKINIEIVSQNKAAGLSLSELQNRASRPSGMLFDLHTLLSPLLFWFVKHSINNTTLRFISHFTCLYT